MPLVSKVATRDTTIVNNTIGGVVAKIYASEIQPAQTRAAANSVAQGLGFVSASTVTCSLSSIVLTRLPVNELVGCIRHASLSRKIFLRPLLSVRWLVLSNCRDSGRVHAGD